MSVLGMIGDKMLLDTNQSNQCFFCWAPNLFTNGLFTPLIFLMGTVVGRMGCIPIVSINVTFVMVMMMELLDVNEP